MTPTTALAHLGLPAMPQNRADLQRQVAGKVDPRRWSWENAAAYQCLWAELARPQGNPAETRVSSCSTPSADGGRGQNRSRSKASERPANLGVYRPGITRRPAA
jgi:hypothetical protein